MPNYRDLGIDKDEEASIEHGVSQLLSRVATQRDQDPYSSYYPDEVGQTAGAPSGATDATQRLHLLSQLLQQGGFSPPEIEAILRRYKV